MTSSSFYPATVGRVSSMQSINRLLFQVHNDQGAIQKLQNQLSTGRRIERPSEDPAAAIRALAAQRSLEFKGQMVTNLKSASTILGATESILSQVQAVLNEMRGVAVESAGNTLSPTEREANASQVSEAIRNLIQLGNSKFRDQYIFGGSNVNQAPFEIAGSSVRFSGTDGLLNTISDLGATLAANVTANETFGIRSKNIVGTVDLDPSLTPDTPLANLNSGSGVRRGSIALSDGTNRIEIDLTRVHNVQDVVDAIQSQSLSGRDLTVAIDQTGLRIDYQDGLGGLLRIEEVGSGLAAGDLGIRTTGLVNNPPIIGSDLNLVTTTQTKLSQLLGGSGIADGSTFVIRQGTREYTIDTTGMQTVEDLINGIDASGARVKASLDPSGRYFTLQSTESGTTLSVGEAGGTLASQLGIRTFDVSTPISRLNNGQGIFGNESSNDLRIVRTDGTELLIDLSGVQTVGDVMHKINAHVDNFDPGLRVVASLSPNGNGLVLSAPAGAQEIQVIKASGSQAATGLGLMPADEQSVSGSAVGTESVISGIDISGVEVEGTYTTLLRLESAIREGDTTQMERLVNALDEDIRRLSMSRGLIGARQQSIEQMLVRTEDQQIQLKEVESIEIESDLAQVISELTTRQAAYQASLQLMGTQSQLSLFNFL